MQGVIIAAGESKRFWPLSTKHKNKAQVSLLGKSLIYWTIKGLAENGIKDIVVVHNPHSSLQEILDKENVRQLADGVQISYVVQEKQLGTGNALAQAREFIKEPFFVLWPNKVNSKEIVAKMAEKQKDRDEVVLVGAQTTNPQDYAVVRFEGEKVAELIEKPEQGKEPSDTKVIGAYLLQPDFFSCYEKISEHHETDFIDVMNLYIKDKKTSLVTLTEDVPTLKYPWELFGVLDILFKSEYFREGTASTAQIGKNVVMEGSVYVGENTVIKANTVIEGPVYIGDNCKIGYSNVLRGPLNVESETITGAFTELKNSIIQKGNHIHSGFFGDSIIGQDGRFGAGFITGNRRLDRRSIKVIVQDEKIDTGLTYLGTVIGDSTKLGIHTGIMPGVFIGSNCVIGPGTQVFEHVQDNMRFYSRQENITREDA
ncbi:NTP transferase domain-containing protein [Patescibacteria group bacterium]|nr:NTP transferase domain-containing protein [Patescibacteria group bacterium]